MPKIGALAVSITLVRSSATRIEAIILSFSSVKSRARQSTPVISPSAFLRPQVLRSSVLILPAFETRGSWKQLTLAPPKVSLKDFVTACWVSLGTIFPTKHWPCSSSEEKPVKSSAFTFHSWTSNFLLTHQIRALAWWRLCRNRPRSSDALPHILQAASRPSASASVHFDMVDRPTPCRRAWSAGRDEKHKERFLRLGLARSKAWSGLPQIAAAA
mmetsp:Transcript_43555/g.94880  ORF Transcript_43555/g.94880 Transcript_43555/m.94880 type:complete len:215 (+) Transcript_43555:2-646(+)